MSGNPDSVEEGNVDFTKKSDENPGKGNVPSEKKEALDSVEKGDENLNPETGEETVPSPDSTGQ